MKIYVGNLSYQVTEDQLREAFAAHGQVDSATIIKDKFSGQSKGFGFVEMTSKEEAEAAIAALNGTDLQGRRMNVNADRKAWVERARRVPIEDELDRRGIHLKGKVERISI